MPEPLHTLNPTTRFTERAGEYDRFRPGYPEAAIDLVLRDLGDPAQLTIADVGAGTGIFARALARRGARVIAIEPNDAMRAAAPVHDPHENIQWRGATGEDTGLAGASVDLVTCAQAFHWLKPEQAIREFCRILRPGGRIALLWNIGDERDPVARGYYEAIRRASSDFTTSHGRIAENPLRRAPLRAQEEHTLPNAQRLDAEGLIGRAMSASYIPRADDSPERRRLIEDLCALHATHAADDGMVTLVYRTHVYLARALEIEGEWTP
jgi:SAM-dependent methyltransferase